MYLKPKELYDLLGEEIIGQEEAKKEIAIAVYNHYKRIEINQKKSNVLLIGPTGSGKTFLIETVAKYLKVPLAICDATTLTESGYVGDDVENILLRLYQTANEDLYLAERGIIYIDEFDKLAKKMINPSITRDVSGEGVQQSLLKIIEGTIATFPIHGGRKHPYGENISFNTKNVLFICGGAFVGLKEIPNKSGFLNHFKEINIKDQLINYGIIPEIIGRIPIIVELNNLKKNDLFLILKASKSSIVKEYLDVLACDKIKLEITNNALLAIADIAYSNNLGARSLRTVFERILKDIMFERNPGTYCIDENYVFDMWNRKIVVKQLQIS